MTIRLFFNVSPSSTLSSSRKFLKSARWAGQSALLSGQPSATISRIAHRVLSFAVSLRICMIRVGFTLICRCSSCTDSSRPWIRHVLNRFIMECASTSGLSHPDTYLMDTSYLRMRSSICASLGGALTRCLLEIDSNGLWSVSTCTCRRNVYWWNRSSSNTMPNISRSMSEYRLSVSVSDLLANAMGRLSCSRAAPSPRCDASTLMVSGFVLS